MAYIPKEHQKYNLLPACKRRGGEVFECPPDLVSKIEKMLGLTESIAPYGYKSYEEYYNFIDLQIELHKENIKVVELFRILKNAIKEMNVKEDWSVLRYVGESTNTLFGLTRGRAYYWPTTKFNPVFSGVIDDEEFTAYQYPTVGSLWEILEDPTGMAYNTIYKNSKGSVSIEAHEDIMAQVHALMGGSDNVVEEIQKDFLFQNPNVFVYPIDAEEFAVRNGRKAHLYFIVEETDDNEIMSKMANRLLSVGCNEWHFCGMQRDKWHEAVDIVYVDSYQDDGEETVLTSGYDTLEDFGDWLFTNLCSNTDEDNYLIYDNPLAYAELLQYWREGKWKE